jgi:DNA-binding transcriptional ArsR family regulator
LPEIWGLPGAAAATTAHPVNAAGYIVWRRRRWSELTDYGRTLLRPLVKGPRGRKFDAPERAEPRDGQRPVYSRTQALELLLAESHLGPLRADTRRTREAIARAMVPMLCESTGILTVGHTTLARLASAEAGYRIARSTVGNHMRAMERAGLITVQQRGASRFVTGGDRHRAPSYAVMTPILAPEEPAGQPGHGHHTLKGRAFDPLEISTYTRNTGGISESPHIEHPDRYEARTARQRRLTAQTLCDRHEWHRWADDAPAELEIVLGPFLRAGWSGAAAMHAIRYRPDGSAFEGPLPDPSTREQRLEIGNLWAVLTARLRCWREPGGQPLPPPVPALAIPRGRPRLTPATQPMTARPPSTRPPSAARAMIDAVLAGVRARRAAHA